MTKGSIDMVKDVPANSQNPEAFGLPVSRSNMRLDRDERVRQLQREGLIGDTPKADNLTDGFENVDELILCSGW